jgi:hypothetical protein
VKRLGGPADKPGKPVQEGDDPSLKTNDDEKVELTDVDREAREQHNKNIKHKAPAK